MRDTLTKLSTNLQSFVNLLQHRKRQFDRHKDWDESDDEELLTSSSDSEQEFEVQAIIGEKEVQGTIYYLVQWKYFPGEDERLREVHLENARDLIEEYELSNS